MTVSGQAAPPPPRLLCDENVAPSLVKRLADRFPGSVHVRDVGLAKADDETIWQYARDGDYLVVTKDDDFRQLCFLAITISAWRPTPVSVAPPAPPTLRAT
jgi:hypothetical protein